MIRDFPGGTVANYLPVNAGDTGNPRDMGSIPGSGRSPGEGNTYSSILAWRIPWTEEPGGLQSMWFQRVGHNEMTKHNHVAYCRKQNINIRRWGLRF